MIIIIPMAGLSSRFAKVGFVLPKYMLHVGSQSLFRLSVSSFECYYHSAHFLFVVRDIFETANFVRSECERLGIRSFSTVSLSRETRGQAETVYLGTKNAGLSGRESVLIFNIDTIRNDFKMPLAAETWDGFLEVFVGDGDNWSYAKTDGPESTKVIETAEKRPISSYCSNGLYYFGCLDDFWWAYEREEVKVSAGEVSELYVAPLYNALISEGKNIHINIVSSEVTCFCGVPAEYFALQKKFYCNCPGDGE